MAIFRQLLNSTDFAWSSSSTGDHVITGCITIICAVVLPMSIMVWQVRWTPHTHNTIRFTALFPGPPGEPVPEENFWTLWCKGRLTEGDTLTIRLRATPSGLTNAYLHHPPIFLQAGCPSCRSTNSIKALKAWWTTSRKFLVWFYMISTTGENPP